MDVDCVANKLLVEQKAKKDSFSLSSSTGTTTPPSDVQEHTTTVIRPYSLYQESYAPNPAVHVFTTPSLSWGSLRNWSPTPPVSIVTGERGTSSSTFSVRINTPPSNSHRPDPIHLNHTASSNLLSANSLRSTRRFSHSPYIVPFPSPRLPRSPLTHVMTDIKTTENVVKEELPATSQPLEPSQPSSTSVEIEPTDSVPKIPPKPASYTIGSPTGSMNMATRRGARPALLGPHGMRSAQHGVSTTRGLLTPQHSSDFRHPPYPSPAPLLTAPISPDSRRFNQSAPAAAPATPLQSTQPVKAPNPYQASLDEIPKSFVMKKLVELAPKYWYSPESADCHIVVPTRRIHKVNKAERQPKMPQTAVPLGMRSANFSGQSQMASSNLSLAEQQAAGAYWRSTSVGVSDGDLGIKPDVVTSSTTEGHMGVSGRRGSLPGHNQLEQCLVFPLHMDYLTTQSTLFHTLISSAKAHVTTPTQRDQYGRLVWQSQAYRGAKVLPTKHNRQRVLYVPLPDPSSFGVLLHWLYWHDVGHFNHCLSRGLVTWQGVIRNIEYLGLDNEIKLLAGKWWKRWVKPVEADERTNDVQSVSGSKKGKGTATDVEFDDDDDEEEVSMDSGADGDDEEIGSGVKAVTEDGFADHVSTQLSLL